MISDKVLLGVVFLPAFGRCEFSSYSVVFTNEYLLEYQICVIIIHIIAIMFEYSFWGLEEIWLLGQEG